jgi:hypothetical protein
MALHRPDGFPEEYWLPVIAAEATSRNRLFSQLEKVPSQFPFRNANWEGVKRVVTEYVSKVAAVFAAQACEAVRDRRLNAAALDASLEGFVDHAAYQAYDLHDEKVAEAWTSSGHDFWDMKSDVWEEIRASAWYRQYLVDVPEIIQAFSTPEHGEKDSQARIRRALVEPRIAAKGWSIAQWATAAGVSQTVAYDYLNGKSEPRPENRTALANALDLEPQDLP